METRRHTYTYRLLKSAWGIRISITATAQLADEAVMTARVPVVSMSWSGTAADLPSEYKLALAAGLSRREAAIADQAEGRRTVVDVEQVEFVESDFQVDGLSVAMCRWAEETFQLEPRHIEENFDRVSNRYLFRW